MKNKLIEEHFTVNFSDCDAGWILMNISYGDAAINIRMSNLYDPLPALLAWLEAIAVGVESCRFTVDEEGSFVGFEAQRVCSRTDRSRAYSTLTVTQNYELPLKITLPTFDLVGIIYRAFRDFAESEAYIPVEWELHTIERAVHEKLGMTSTQWMESVIGLNSRELQKAIWLIDRTILSNPSGDTKSTGTEAELMELTGMTREEAGGLPMYFVVTDEDWGADFAARQKYLEECLVEKSNPSWDGCPWREMRSSLIETYLKVEIKPVYLYWKKWISEDK